MGHFPWHCICCVKYFFDQQGTSKEDVHAWRGRCSRETVDGKGVAKPVYPCCARAARLLEAFSGRYTDTVNYASRRRLRSASTDICRLKKGRPWGMSSYKRSWVTSSRGLSFLVQNTNPRLTCATELTGLSLTGAIRLTSEVIIICNVWSWLYGKRTGQWETKIS